MTPVIDAYAANSALRLVCAGMRRLDLVEAAAGVLEACTLVADRPARLWINGDGQWSYTERDGELIRFCAASSLGHGFPPAVLDAGTGHRVQRTDAWFLPLGHNGRIIGVLEAPAPERGTAIEDLLPIELMATAVGVCLDARNIQRSFLASLERVARSLEAREPYANGHSDRVARYAAEIARVLGCSPDEIEQIYHAAVLHDLGKAGVPVGILDKAGPLSESEMDAIRQHPRLGAEIIATLGFLHGVTETVRSHHEWYNGDGYLDGLSGERIPLGARIIAVADAFEAMTADRAYRRAMPEAKVLERLRKGAGTQWDSQVVSALLSILAVGPLD